MTKSKARISPTRRCSGRSRKIEMTMRYAHLSPDVRRDAVRALDPDLGQGTA